MASYLKSVVGGFAETLDTLKSQDGNAITEALERARRSLAVEYVLAFKTPGASLTTFLTVVGRMIDNMIGTNGTKEKYARLLLRVATKKPKSDGRGVGHLDTVLAKKGDPLLFLTAVWKAGLLDELVGAPLGEDETYEDRGWGNVGDASEGWCKTARTRDLEPFRRRKDIPSAQVTNQIATLVRQHRDGAEVDPESEQVKALRWFEDITGVYITLLATGELENYGGGVDGFMGGGVGGEGGGGGGGIGGGAGINPATSGMVSAANSLLGLSAVKVTEEYVHLFAEMAISKVLLPRQLFPSSGNHQSSFIDIGIWHGVTKRRAKEMVEESRMMVEERKEKVYKAWITALLDCQAVGAKNATPGYLARMNPNYARWGVDPTTRDRYAGAAGQLLAWGVRVQK
ncbi:hypothetical protein TrRE_jg10035, partial [Triparma retinervis]